jgi:putative ABC transport system permease protein
LCGSIFKRNQALSVLISGTMIKNYLKIATRHLLRNKTLSFINILGLSLGMAFALLTGMWIRYEQSFDAFNKNKDQIALVLKHMVFNNQKSTSGSVMLPLYDELRNNYPEIKRATRLDRSNVNMLVTGNSKFTKTGYYADPDILKMFTFPLLKGNPETALNDPNSIVLTESLAKTLFGNKNPLGKTIRIDNQFNVQVSAVMQDIPKNSSLEFEFLAPFEFKIQHFSDTRDSKTRWNNSFISITVELKEGTSMDAFSKKIRPLLANKDEYIKTQILSLFPMTMWRLYDDFKDWESTGGRIEYVRLFGVIGAFVLLIACINFMNLSTARFEKRAKEVGIRKSVGSKRGQLIAQFLTESVFTAFLAFLLALLLMQLVLPYIKDLGFENISFDFGNASLWLSVLAVCLLTGLIAGSYPALYLSSFLPVRVLKGSLQQGKSATNFRKLLVVSQFVVSIGLIVSTITVYQQIRHAQKRAIGYNPDNLITLDATQDLKKNYNSLRHELLNTGYVEVMAKASSAMTWINNDFTHFSWDGKEPGTDMTINVVMTDWDYEKTAGLEFIEGRSFAPEYKTDSNAVILNEAALKLMGYKDPVGKTIKLGDQVLTIIGIIKNVVMQDPFKPVAPGVILFSGNNVNSVLIRLKKNVDLRKSLAAIQPIVNKYNPSVPFEYHFADEEFGKKFATENQVAKLAGIFACLAIFISCMGLFGLAMFMAERRSKEISVRKVLGATVANLWLLLSREFMWLVAIASAIASPLTFWLMNNWLEKYEYRIEINWWILALAGLCAMFVALATISFQTIKAAFSNPARSLRAE